jgi:hypothetical protein
VRGRVVGEPNPQFAERRGPLQGAGETWIAAGKVGVLAKDVGPAGAVHRHDEGCAVVEMPGVDCDIDETCGDGQTMNNRGRCTLENGLHVGEVLQQADHIATDPTKSLRRREPGRLGELAVDIGVERFDTQDDLQMELAQDAVDLSKRGLPITGFIARQAGSGESRALGELALEQTALGAALSK